MTESESKSTIFQNKSNRRQRTDSSSTKLTRFQRRRVSVSVSASLKIANLIERKRIEERKD